MTLLHFALPTNPQLKPHAALFLPRWVISNSSLGRRKMKKENAILTIPHGKTQQHLAVRAPGGNVRD